jgi:three-Cys-motif partner protein
VRELVQAAAEAAATLNPRGLHLTFADPYSLGSLDFQIIDALAKLERIDLIMHVRAMDLQRNLPRNLAAEAGDFDAFCPGWREDVQSSGDPFKIRSDVVACWQKKIAALGVWPSPRAQLITGHGNQRLYWLMLAARHQLAHKFWKVAANPRRQYDMFDD